MKKITLAFILTFLLLPVSDIISQPEMSASAGRPGAFSRIGFGARGIGMGNALAAVKTGGIAAYHNPALSVFQNDNYFSAGYTFLGYDRSLNYLNFTRRFEFSSGKDSVTGSVKARATAGISAGIINSGVSNIEERDNQGILRGNISTSENQFYLSVANKFSEKFALGITTKFYYYKLYEDVTSTSLGFDIGFVYSYNENLTFGFVISDLNSKYKWDTSPVYGTSGTTTTDNFPVTKRLGASYYLPDEKLLIAAEYLFDNYESQVLRAGAEYNIYDKLFIRGGVDNLNLSNKDDKPRPSLGFSYSKVLGTMSAGIDYAFQVENYSSSHRHVVNVFLVF